MYILGYYICDNCPHVKRLKEKENDLTNFDMDVFTENVCRNCENKEEENETD